MNELQLDLFKDLPNYDSKNKQDENARKHKLCDALEKWFTANNL